MNNKKQLDLINVCLAQLEVIDLAIAVMDKNDPTGDITYDLKNNLMQNKTYAIRLHLLKLREKAEKTEKENEIEELLTQMHRDVNDLLANWDKRRISNEDIIKVLEGFGYKL